mgnify:CR=1 FL=1
MGYLQVVVGVVVVADEAQAVCAYGHRCVPPYVPTAVQGGYGIGLGYSTAERGPRWPGITLFTLDTLRAGIALLAFFSCLALCPYWPLWPNSSAGPLFSLESRITLWPYRPNFPF